MNKEILIILNLRKESWNQLHHKVQLKMVVCVQKKIALNIRNIICQKVLNLEQEI